MSAPAPDHLSIRDNPARFGLRIQGERLAIEGVALETIAREVGTPVYVYGSAHVADRYRSLAAALAARPTLICYAVKANGSLAILRTLARLGAGADIVSIGELERALDAGVPPHKIVFSGVGKRSSEIDAALALGIRSINVESEDELEQVAARARATGQRARISLRINPDVDPDTHPYLATGLRESKFGIAMDEGLALALAARGHDVLAIGDGRGDQQLLRGCGELDEMPSAGGVEFAFGGGDEAVDRVGRYGHHASPLNAKRHLRRVVEVARSDFGNDRRTSQRQGYITSSGISGHEAQHGRVRHW